MAYQDQQRGMSGKKKWLIGCSGCLGVIIMLVVAVVLLGGMGFDALKGASNKSVTSMFGADFKTEPYAAVGLPFDQKSLKNMVMLVDQQRGVVMIAVETTVTEVESKMLQSADPKMTERFLTRIANQINNSQRGSSQMKDLRFDRIKPALLANKKSVVVAEVTVEAERRGASSYSPAVAAIIPEADDQLVVLVGLNGQSSSSNPDTDFSHVQADLQAEVVRIVNQSELDDRLISTPGKPISFP